MIGLRTGPCTLKAGVAAGLSADPFSTSGFTTLDATSNKAVPITAAEFTAAGFNAPQNLWRCQEAAGNLADSIGAVTLTANGVSTYRNAVAGWSLKSINMTDGAAAVAFSTTSIQNVATTSGLMLAYVTITGAAAAEREVFGMGSGTDHRYVSITTTPRYKATGLAGATVTGTATPGSTVHPLIVKVDRAASSFTVYTDQEKLNPAWTNPSGGGAVLGFGDMIAAGAPPCGFLYVVFWSGTSAEMSDSTVRSLLTAMGWSVAW